MVTDSMTWRGTEDGRLQGVLERKGFSMTTANWSATVAACCAVVGGYERVRELSMAHAEADFASAMGLLYADLIEAESLSRMVAQVAAGPEFQGPAFFGPDGTSPALLAIGGGYGDTPGLVRIKPGSRQSSGFLCIGGWSNLAGGHAERLESQPVPPTLDAAAEMAVDGLRQYIAEHYDGQSLEQYLAERRRLPGCAFPLWLTKATGSGNWTHQINS